MGERTMLFVCPIVATRKGSGTHRFGTTENGDICLTTQGDEKRLVKEALKDRYRTKDLLFSMESACDRADFLS